MTPDPKRPATVNSEPKPADTIVSPEQEPRLPPVLNYGAVPRIDLATWDFRVYGLVEKPVRWTYSEFLALPQVQVRSDIHCVTRWSRFDNLWQGVSFKELLRHVRVKAEARHAVIHAEQSYTTNLPLTELEQDDVLFAYRHDGRDLTPEHGWPLRLVVPRRYFWKSAKWVRGLELVAEDRPGFWEQNGYHNEANPWSEERFSDW
jgi:DMSO/TMAO reductase YedYZ molybdopterin-dependent catalytic subunit